MDVLHPPIHRGVGVIDKPHLGHGKHDQPCSPTAGPADPPVPPRRRIPAQRAERTLIAVRPRVCRRPLGGSGTEGKKF